MIKSSLKRYSNDTPVKNKSKGSSKKKDTLNAAKNQGKLKIDSKKKPVIIDKSNLQTKTKIKRTNSLPNIKLCQNVPKVSEENDKGRKSRKTKLDHGSIHPRVFSLKRKFVYRSWSTSPHKNTVLYKKLPSNYNTNINKRYRVVLPRSVYMYFNQLSSNSSFVGFSRPYEPHEHKHRTTPHLNNSTTCEDIRYVSGYDKNRRSRFYFTSNKTPVRVYFNYGPPQQIEAKYKIEKLKQAVNTIQLNIKHESKQSVADTNRQQMLLQRMHRARTDLSESSTKRKYLFSGKKLSPNALKRVNISEQFLHEAKSLLFSEESLSFFPAVESSSQFFRRKSLTLAEMAIMPFNLVPLSTDVNPKPRRTIQINIKKNSTRNH